MRRLLNATTITLLALAVPIAALANVTGTPTLTSGQTLSLDTGIVASSGGDILWNPNTGITPQGSATALNLTAFSSSFSGSTAFSALSQSTLSIFPGYSSAAIPVTGLAVNNIFAVKTNGGNYAAVLVTALGGGTITLQFVAYVSTVPTITQVINNYSLIPGGFVNSGIAPGTLFIIKGSLLASATSVTTLQSTTGGSTLPTTLNGASVAVTVGSVTVHPAFYYAENIQLALVMPSTTPIGAGTVTVTYNNQTTAPFNINVVASAFGFAASSGTGIGLAHAQDLNYGYYTYTNSINPGSTIRLIGSGLGADPTRDLQYVQPTAASAINALAHVYVGGVDAPIFYQGPEGYPGVDEIDVTIPSSVPTGCGVSVVGVSTSGVPTNTLTLAIGSGVCQDPALGINGTTLTTETTTTNENVNSGSVSLIQATEPATSGTGTTTSQYAAASFENFTGSTTSSGTTYVISIGGCIVSETAGIVTGNVTETGLNAGAVTVTGPGGGPVALTSLASLDPNLPSAVGSYTTINPTTGASTLPAGFIPTTGGSFTFTGTGGTTAPEVGPFTTPPIIFSNPLFNWTNQAAAATVTRSAGQLITWTSGTPGTYVYMSGSSSSANGSISGTFTCYAPVAALQFTVPSYVLAALPAGSGSLGVGNSTAPVTFTATGLTNGTGSGSGIVSIGVNAAYN